MKEKNVLDLSGNRKGTGGEAVVVRRVGDEKWLGGGGDVVPTT